MFFAIDNVWFTLMTTVLKTSVAVLHLHQKQYNCTEVVKLEIIYSDWVYFETLGY